MLIPPKYLLTPKISESLQSIEASRAVINSIIIPPEIETNIRRKSFLKSSLFSARIEGNPLTLDEYIKRPSKDQRRIEVANILKAVTLIYKSGGRDILVSKLLSLHQQVMQGLIDREEVGRFRTSTNAIFNVAGIAIYLPPPPRHVNPLIDRLLKFINSSKEQFVPIRACLAHYQFEKIHPFLDGNGRVGRLLIQMVMQKSNYGMKGLLSIEEYLDNHRSEYYRALEDKEKDVTDYLEFMLEAIAQTALIAKTEVLTKQQSEAKDFLLPRRAEILNIIQDHQLVSFDLIRRRFQMINERTLRFDLKKLADQGFIRKRGITKGAYYEIIS